MRNILLAAALAACTTSPAESSIGNPYLTYHPTGQAVDFIDGKKIQEDITRGCQNALESHEVGKIQFNRDTQELEFCGNVTSPVTKYTLGKIEVELGQCKSTNPPLYKCPFQIVESKEVIACLVIDVLNKEIIGITPSTCDDLIDVEKGIIREKAPFWE